MDQVDHSRRADVDHLLKWAAAAWEELPEVEREIDGWRLEDQLVFTEEWPIEEDRLKRLAERANQPSRRASLRFRRVCGEHEVDAQPAEQC